MTQQSENLLTRLKTQYGTLSKGQKRLADYIMEHYDKAVFMTAARLGEEVGVSESTAVRLPPSWVTEDIRNFTGPWRSW